MNIDPTIYGYVGDGYLLCPACAAKRQTPYDDAGLEPLGAYSGILDRPCGELCDDCLDYFVEPWDDHGTGPEGCQDCGFLAEPEDD